MADTVKESEYGDADVEPCRGCGQVTDDFDGVCSACREEMEQDC